MHFGILPQAIMVISAAGRADTMPSATANGEISLHIYLDECNIRAYSIDTFQFGTRKLNISIYEYPKIEYFNLPRIFLIRLIQSHSLASRKIFLVDRHYAQITSIPFIRSGQKSYCALHPCFQTLQISKISYLSVRGVIIMCKAVHLLKYMIYSGAPLHA